MCAVLSGECDKNNNETFVLVMAQLGLGPNEGSVMILTKVFLAEPSVFQGMCPHVMLLGVCYEFVELMHSPWDLS
jgi:hypothetical protein